MTEENTAKEMVDAALAVKRLAALSPMEYARRRKPEAKSLGVTAATLDREVEALRKKRAKEAPKDAVSPIDADKAKIAAGDLVACADILKRFEDAITKAGLVGETSNAKILYLALTSRLLEKLVSAAVKGVSSGGKSFTVESVLRFFPLSAYFTRTSWSEKAAYFSDENFCHRFIVLYEAAGGEGETQSYIIRTLLSEGCLKYEIAEKTDEGIRARLIEKEGPTGLITTTTQAKLHPENETRLLSLGVIDTPDQTKAVMRTLAADAAYAVDYAPWWAFQEWLATGEHRVAVPFAGALAEAIPPIAVRLRRDFGALLSLIRAHALLHRGARKRDGQGRIVATVADYGAVYHLVEKLFSEGIEATVPAVIRETVGAVKEYLDEAEAPAITLTQLAKELDLDKGAVHHRVKKAITAGYLVNQEERRGKPARIILGDDLPEEKSLLPKPEALGLSECPEPGKDTEYEYPSGIASTLQHPPKTSDGTRDLTVEEPSSTAFQHPTVAVECGVTVEEPSSTVKSLPQQQFSPTVEVLKPNPDHIGRRDEMAVPSDCGGPPAWRARVPKRGSEPHREWAESRRVELQSIRRLARRGGEAKGLCDHCGRPNPDGAYDWPGRPDGVRLHHGCEGAWFDQEKVSRTPGDSLGHFE